MSALKVGNIRACVSLSPHYPSPFLYYARVRKGGRSRDPTFSFPFDGGGERSLLTLLYFWRRRHNGWQKRERKREGETGEKVDARHSRSIQLLGTRVIGRDNYQFPFLRNTSKLANLKTKCIYASFLACLGRGVLLPPLRSRNRLRLPPAPRKANELGTGFDKKELWGIFAIFLH